MTFCVFGDVNGVTQYRSFSTWCRSLAVTSELVPPPPEMLVGGRGDPVRAGGDAPQGATAAGAVGPQAVPLQEPLHQGLAPPPPQVCPPSARGGGGGFRAAFFGEGV